MRIGNAAYQQLQLDIYGEMMDSTYLANKYGHAMSHRGWQNVQRILKCSDKTGNVRMKEFGKYGAARENSSTPAS